MRNSRPDELQGTEVSSEFYRVFTVNSNATLALKLAAEAFNEFIGGTLLQASPEEYYQNCIHKCTSSFIFAIDIRVWSYAR